MFSKRPRRDFFLDNSPRRQTGVESGVAARLLAGALHSRSHLAHGQDFDIPSVAGSSKVFQKVSEQGEPVGGFGQVFGMKTEMKYPSMACSCFHPPAEAFETRSQSEHPSSRRPDWV